MSTWIDPNDSNFNAIEDGAPVAQSTTDVVIDNIKTNLTYLYTELATLQKDKSSLVLYGEPVAVDPLVGLVEDDYKPGMPVFLYEGAWKPAGIEVDPNENTESTWGYDLPSFTCGLILKKYSSGGETVIDVILTGDCKFDVLEEEAEDSIIGPTGDNIPLSDLFTDDCFVDVSYHIDKLKSGVYYLSSEAGKLSIDTTYTITIGVVFVVKDGTDYYIRYFVMPEGLAGHRKHQHESIALHPGLASLTQQVITGALPPLWGTDVNGLLPTSSLNVGGDNVAYPYADLVGSHPAPINAGAEGAAVTLLYDGAEAIQSHGGWLSVDDPYFNDSIELGGLGLLAENIPDNAIWGYAVNKIDKFNYSWSSINGVYDLDSMTLAINGQPVNKNHYIIDEYGIWWVQDGYENAPFQTRINYTKSLDLFYVTPVTASENASIGSIASTRLLVNRESATASIDPLDGFLSAPLTPALPFNPTLDMQRADIDTANEGLNARQVMTPMTVRQTIEQLFAVTAASQDKSARVSTTGDFNSLTEGGFWRAVSHQNAPSGLGTEYLGMVIKGDSGSVAQIFILVGNSASYYRIGQDNLIGGTDWTGWIQINDQGVLPGCIVMWPSDIAPSGWLPCDGRQVNVAASPQYGGLLASLGNRYGGDGYTTFNLPDYRAMFVRGWNGTRADEFADNDERQARPDGVSGNVVGTTQMDEFGAHSHKTYRRTISARDNDENKTTSIYDEDGGLDTSVEGGVETRPKNISVMYIIKY